MKIEHIQNATAPFVFRCKASELAAAAIAVCKECKTRSITLQFADGACQLMTSSGKCTVNGTLEGSGYLMLKKTTFIKLMKTFKESEEVFKLTDSTIGTDTLILHVWDYEF